MKIFENIYKYNLWLFGSGSGSIKIKNIKYITCLQNFLKQKKITSVCDLGCGDWQLSQHIDWSNINYC